MTARKHHYLPQCYLKGFTKDRRNPKLFVVDLKAAKWFWTAPANVAAERDFNRIDADGIAPDALEERYAKFEGEVASALERTVRTRGFANPEDRILILNLLGLIAFRNPRLRETVRGFQESLLKMVAGVMISTPDRFRAVLDNMHADGAEAPEISYEDMKAFVEGDEYRIGVPTMQHIRHEFEAFENVLPILFDRNWSVMKAPPGSSGFVTSDHPACLMWADPKERARESLWPPGYAMAKTIVLFPLSKELALVGKFEGAARDRDVSEAHVASFNAAIMYYAERQIYAQDDEFSYLMRRGEGMRRGAELLEYLKRSKKPRPGA